MSDSLLNETCFHDNIQLWSRTNPRKALLLQYSQDDSIQFCKSENGSLNLSRTIEGETSYYHDKINPQAEAEHWFASLDLRIATVIYVYGIGLGYYYSVAKEWLKANPKRSIVFLEDNPTVIHRLFQTELGTEILKDRQVVIFCFDDLKDPEGLFEELYWDFILTQMAISALEFYARHKKEKYLELKHKIVHDAAIKNALVEEYLHYGVAFFRNFYPNMLLLSESWQGTHLYGKFENIPAIICGAGPSLERNIHQLSQYLDKAIVFGGGSALNALSSRGILPHFGIGIDPNPTQEYRLSTNKAYEVPLFYRNRMHADAFKLIHGPRLYIPGAGGYEVSDWFDEKFDLLKEIEWLDEGHNVVNFGMELANLLGCNPIIFVGVDLAYTDMQSYVSGIIEDTSVSKKDILETDDFDTTALLKEDIYGKPIYTLWKWIAESEWAGEYAKTHPNLTIINSTEGGLGMPGIPNIPLAEVAQQYLQRSYDLRSRVMGEILCSGMPEITDSSVVDATKELKLSIERSMEYIDQLIEDNLKYHNKLTEERKVPEIRQSGLAALAEIELEEEPAYEYIIGVFNLVYSRILNKEIQLINSSTQSISEWKKQVEINQVNLKRLRFMHDVAYVNLEIINRALEERLEQLRG